MDIDTNQDTDIEREVKKRDIRQAEKTHIHSPHRHARERQVTAIAEADNPDHRRKQ